ncbi:tautomerase family protein [Comamonas testosteroni]|uniref:tautomerase family protein n=1 Tax=Comamonas testosteroni TaxID=285 RepID=UPI003AF1E249
MSESFLPRLTVSVFFEQLAKTGFSIGGGPPDGFVCGGMDHVVRFFRETEARQGVVEGCARMWEPSVAACGFAEGDVDEIPSGRWMLNGMRPRP